MRVSISKSIFPWKAHRLLGLVNQKNGKGLLVRASPWAPPYVDNITVVTLIQLDIYINANSFYVIWYVKFY